MSSASTRSSLALHLASALLLWELLRRLGVRLAWVGGLLFAVHPLVVESVAWVSELKNTLSLPFLLLAMIAYVDYDEARTREPPGPERKRAYGRCLAWFVLALLTKSSGVMFPAVILLYAWWKRGIVTPADGRASAPFFALALARGLVTMAFQQHWLEAGAAVAQGGLLSRIEAAGVALGFYLEKAVWPAGLTPDLSPLGGRSSSLWQFLPWLRARPRLRRPLGPAAAPGGALSSSGWVSSRSISSRSSASSPSPTPQTSWVSDHLALSSAGRRGRGAGRLARGSTPVLPRSGAGPGSAPRARRPPRGRRLRGPEPPLCRAIRQRGHPLDLYGAARARLRGEARKNLGNALVRSRPAPRRPRLLRRGRAAGPGGRRPAIRLRHRPPAGQPGAGGHRPLFAPPSG